MTVTSGLVEIKTQYGEIDAGALRERLTFELAEAERKAFDALARYKFQMFGYWAAIWVHLNHLDGGKRPSPFRSLVRAARHREAPKA